MLHMYNKLNSKNFRVRKSPSSFFDFYNIEKQFDIMSFMYNPFPFDDPRPVNRPELCEKTVEAIVGGGTPAVKPHHLLFVVFAFINIHLIFS